mmetsp:Transcript_51443/g.121872  ORF Transcript_51443/g.121872 Transcript_51443/m.121872 type:complete len:462 (-) Transcript_51443:913-2298(-)
MVPSSERAKVLLSFGLKKGTQKSSSTKTSWSKDVGRPDLRSPSASCRATVQWWLPGADDSHTSPTAKIRKNRMKICHMEWHTSERSIIAERSGWFRGYGRRFSTSGRGSSVASASDANESMIMLTHSSWMTVSGDLVRTDAPRTAIAHAVRFTVSWNWRNLQMLSYTQRPHFTACTMDAKLSSRTIMSAAFLATCVPALPMAKPTSARFSAGASLVPSPVTATVCGFEILDCWIPVTRVSLSSGDDRASTRKSIQILSNSSMLISSSGRTTLSRNCAPVITWPSSISSPRIPHFLAIAAAVRALSPVTIRTTIPASLHARIAPGTSGRTGSSRPRTARRMRSSSRSLGSSSPAAISRYATVSVRRPSSAIFPIASSNRARAPASIAVASPPGCAMREQSSSTTSDAPLVYTRRAPPPPLLGGGGGHGVSASLSLLAETLHDLHCLPDFARQRDQPEGECFE